MAKRLCIRDCKIDELPFISGLEYNVDFNSPCKKLIISNPYGYTFISKEMLDKHFI